MTLYNLHYILIQNDDKDSAKEFVENILDKDSSVYTYNVVDVYDLKTQQDKINIILNELNDEFSDDEKDGVIEYIDELEQRLSCGDSHIYYMIGRAYIKLSEIIRRSKSEPYTIDNLITSESFNGWKYDKYGLTNGIYSYDDTLNTYLVAVEIE